MDSILRWASSVLSPDGEKARLTVVTFHRVLDGPDSLQPELPTREGFIERLDWLERQFDILPLEQACNDLFEGKLKQRSAAITFDDGYRDNLSNALSMLQSRGLSATVFVATGFSSGKNMFNDEIIEAVRRTKKHSVDAKPLKLGTVKLDSTTARLSAINVFTSALKYLPLKEREHRLKDLHTILGTEPAQALMMSNDEIRSLRGSRISIGAHTRNHPILLREEDAIAKEEIDISRTDIKRVTGVAPNLFAFPNGKYDDDFSLRHCDMVKEAGFSFGFTTDPASASMMSDRFRLPRVSLWAPTRMRTGLSLLRNLRENSP